ncbi:hypothetical protein C8R46DRAFT_1046835 [Mycena filopes]|nr:hypothetical protein C8R46DRAFT_1046835 [Mycena filopes]
MIFPAFLSLVFPALVNSAIVPRAPGVFACLDPNFTGQCSIFNHTSGECVNFAPPFNNNVSSFSTDDGDCAAYLQVIAAASRVSLLDADCCGASLNVTVAEPRDSFPPGFDDAISSFR